MWRRWSPTAFTKIFRDRALWFSRKAAIFHSRKNRNPSRTRWKNSSENRICKLFVLLRAGEIRLAVADLVFPGDFDFDAAVSVRRPARIGVVAQAVLRAQLAIDAVEDGVELLRGVGKKHRPAHGVGDGFKGMLASGVAAAFVFYRANHDGVEERAGTHRFLARGVEVAAAGGFTGVRHQNDDAAAVFATAPKGARTQQNGVVNRCACAVGEVAHSGLQRGYIVGEAGHLGDVFVDRINRQAIAGTKNLVYEMRGGLLLESNLFVSTKAGVDHQRQIERQLRFGFEDVDFLLGAFFEEPEELAWQVGCWAIVFVEYANQDVHEVDVDANAAPLRTSLLPIVVGSCWRFWCGIAFRFLCPGRAVGLVLSASEVCRNSGSPQHKKRGKRKQGRPSY